MKKKIMCIFLIYVLILTACSNEQSIVENESTSQLEESETGMITSSLPDLTTEETSDESSEEITLSEHLVEHASIHTQEVDFLSLGAIWINNDTIASISVEDSHLRLNIYDTATQEVEIKLVDLSENEIGKIKKLEKASENILIRSELGYFLIGLDGSFIKSYMNEDIKELFDPPHYSGVYAMSYSLRYIAYLEQTEEGYNDITDSTEYDIILFDTTYGTHKTLKTVSAPVLMDSGAFLAFSEDSQYLMYGNVLEIVEVNDEPYKLLTGGRIAMSDGSVEEMELAESWAYNNLGVIQNIANSDTFVFWSLAPPSGLFSGFGTYQFSTGRYTPLIEERPYEEEYYVDFAIKNNNTYATVSIKTENETRIYNLLTGEYELLTTTPISFYDYLVSPDGKKLFTFTTNNGVGELKIITFIE